MNLNFAETGKNETTALILRILLGWVGAHRLYLGDKKGLWFIAGLVVHLCAFSYFIYYFIFQMPGDASGTDFFVPQQIAPYAVTLVVSGAMVVFIILDLVRIIAVASRSARIK